MLSHVFNALIGQIISY